MRHKRFIRILLFNVILNRNPSVCKSVKTSILFMNRAASTETERGYGVQHSYNVLYKISTIDASPCNQAISRSVGGSTPPLPTERLKDWRN